MAGATLRRAPRRRSSGARVVVGLAAAPAVLVLLMVVLVVLLAGGAAQQLKQQCGTGLAALPGAFNGPGSLGGVAGTGLTAAQVQTVRAGSPYAGTRITPGEYEATAYGPPWGGIQGTGQSMSGGVVLNGGAPRLYAIAVDPTVISHGTLVYAWPNPFGWRGPFMAADTGGAINGRRIDFYDWRGRITQTRWGTRSVRVSPTPIKPGGPDVTTASLDFTAATDTARDATGDPVGFAIVDANGKTIAEFDGSRPNVGRSMSKALILLALTRRAASRQLTTAEQQRATAMIELSDNRAASQLYRSVGGAAVDRAARAAGMTGWRRDTRDPVYTLGESTVTALDFARLFAQLDELVPARHRAMAERLLRDVQGAGRFGLLDAGVTGPVLSKGGWSPEDRRGWTVNQAARLTVGGHDYGIAVVLGGQSSFAAGAAQIKRIGEALATPAAPVSECGTLIASGPLGARIGKLARSHLGAGPSIAGFEPPTIGVAWCAWFATNVWRKAGVQIPISTFSGFPYTWAESKGLLFKKVGERPLSGTPPAGAALMYGTSPQDLYTSQHVNLVDAILEDGSFMYTGGNQSAPGGNAVTRHGPCRLSRTDPAYLSGPGCDTRPIYGIALPGKETSS